MDHFNNLLITRLRMIEVTYDWKILESLQLVLNCPRYEINDTSEKVFSFSSSSPASVGFLERKEDGHDNPLKQRKYHE